MTNCLDLVLIGGAQNPFLRVGKKRPAPIGYFGGVSEKPYE